jgi:alpha-mannosidase
MVVVLVYTLIVQIWAGSSLTSKDIKQISNTIKADLVAKYPNLESNKITFSQSLSFWEHGRNIYTQDYIDTGVFCYVVLSGGIEYDYYYVKWQRVNNDIVRVGLVEKTNKQKEKSEIYNMMEK